MLSPRPYQIDTARRVWSLLQNKHRNSCLIQAPTGTGKTVTGAFFVDKWLEHVKTPVLAMAHRREIVHQTVNKMHDAGLPASTIMSGEGYSPSNPVQVASIDTLAAWMKKGKIELPKFGLVWIDEAHRGMGMRYQSVIEYFMQRRAKLIGTTATPIRTDGVGLGRMFEEMVQTPGIPWMIQQGFLTPITYRVGIVPTTKGIKLTAGDYNQAELEKVMDQQLLIGDVIENWLKHAQGRPTMVFASGIQHSMHLVNTFREHGVRAEHIDGETPQKLRDSITAKLTTGDIDVVSNAQVYIEGMDIPAVSCIVLAQPTKSIGKYLQIAGRGLRPYPGKENCMILDHAGAVHEHGLVEIDREWMLTDGKEQVEKMRETKEKQPVTFICKECGYIFSGYSSCPACGMVIHFTGNAKDYLPAELIEMTQGAYDAMMARKRHAKARDYTIEEKMDFYSQLLGYAVKKGHKDGWAANAYRKKFGVWPSKRPAPKEPGHEVLNYARSQMIAYAKHKQAQARTEELALGMARAG